MGTPLKLLIFQEPETDTRPLLQPLRQGGFELDYDMVTALYDLEDALSRAQWDILLCDHCLSQVALTLEALKKSGSDAALIVIAQGIAVADAVALIKAGVNDLVYRDNLASLVPIAERELRELYKRRQARAALRENEHRYRTIFDTVPVSIWELDLSKIKMIIDRSTFQQSPLDFRRYLERHPEFVQELAGLMKVLDVNAVTLDLYGAHSQKELQAGLTKVLVSQTFDLFHELLVAIAEGKTHFKGETLCRTLRGHYIHVIASLAIPSENSAFKNTLLSVVDITAQKEAEKALAKSRQNFQNVVVKNQTGMLITDWKGTVLFANGAAQALLGRGEKELEGEQLGLPLAAEHMTEIDMIRPDQSIGMAEMSVTRTEWEGKPAILAMLHDVTERKRAEDARRKMEEESQRRKEMLEELVRERTTELLIAKNAAEAANRAKSTFLANMSHELRTPLHGILSFARLGIKKNTTAAPEKRLHYFERINDSAEVLLTLLNDLLDLAKLESGKMSFEFQPADLGMIIYKVIDEFRPLAGERRIAIDFERPRSRNQVYLDKTKMMQVLRNLLSNAIKFSPPGGRIQISLSQGEHSVLAIIRDQGIGIPDSELEAVFDKFIQSSKTKTGAGGTGLGLSICREIIAFHRGRVWAENNPEGGARFTFEIPLDLRYGADPLPALDTANPADAPMNGLNQFKSTRGRL